MKHNLLNFTRGSQLLGHFGFMFAAGLKGPLIVTGLVAVGTCYWEVRSALSDHQIYLVWMHIYASLYAFMEFDPASWSTLSCLTAKGSASRLASFASSRRCARRSKHFVRQ